jgi:hypothetical protein
MSRGSSASLAALRRVYSFNLKGDVVFFYDVDAGLVNAPASLLSSEAAG